MRKYVIGMFVGCALSFAVSAQAEIVSMIGKTIDGAFPVKVSGKQLEQTAIVVEGTSYLPVRAIGDALNMDVSFNADLGIELKQKEVTPVVNQTTTTKTQTPTVLTPEKKAQKLKNIDDTIADLKSNIKGIQMGIEVSQKANPEDPDLKTYKDRMAKYESDISDLEKQKAELQNQP